MKDTRAIFDWLVDGAPGADNAAEVVGRMSEAILASGIPLQRTAAFVRTLHPELLGRSFVWRPGAAVITREAPFTIVDSESYRTSTIAAVSQLGKAVRQRPMDPAWPNDYPGTHTDLVAEGVTDYLAAPLRFLNGQTHTITFATTHPAGFTDEQIATLLDLTRPLARVGEILALSRTAVNLLDAYVGRNAGAQILAGKIHRGDVDTIRAVIWFSDLRGFTELSGSVEPAAVISVLNELFECQVEPIQRNGGEVLKFSGDGLLAIFPITSEHTPSERCDAALAAARDAFAALARVNEDRTKRAERPIRFGLALHLGDVAYGNIGGAGRLDFTCIGPAVNLTSRLEGLTGKLERPLVVSQELARLTASGTVSLGAFELKGVAAPQDVFGMPDGDPLARW
ncbi:MAG: Adenylate cyclase [Myxococcaceae bacterium]|nr:Adenylate cyclase [Myxococcaceae bacterium]